MTFAELQQQFPFLSISREDSEIGYLLWNTEEQDPDSQWSSRCALEQELCNLGWEFFDIETDHNSICGYVRALTIPSVPIDL